MKTNHRVEESLKKSFVSYLLQIRAENKTFEGQEKNKPSLVEKSSPDRRRRHCKENDDDGVAFPLLIIWKDFNFAK